MNVLGIDPGLTGALASWDGEWLNLLAMPIMKASGRGNEVNWAELVNRFNVFLLDGVDHAYIERVGARPGQGVSSMFKFGYVSGGLRGLVASHRIPVTFVTPGKWKKALGLNSSKDAARARASELFPKQSQHFARKKDDGVAEAALIAYYGYQQMTGEKE
jgi:crossover junction endodeoxyribonuclease RuvC